MSKSIFVNNFFRPMNRILEYITMKKMQAAALSALATITAFFAPLIPFLVLMLAMVYADYWIGKKAAIAENQKLIDMGHPDAKRADQVITSSGKRRTIDKAISYAVALILSEGFWQIFLYSLPLTEMMREMALSIKVPTFWMAFVVCKVEYLSYLESSEKITGNREIVPLVKVLFKKAEDKMPKE